MMRSIPRAALGLAILLGGLGAEAGVEYASRADRPPLDRPLAEFPTEIGSWVGRDEPVDEKIARESQATEYLNRVYVDRDHPGRSLTLWMNYSEFGLNMRHSPAVCLPSGGWELVESLTTETEVALPSGDPHKLTLLGYSRGELVQRIGFWYYIFGEGRVEKFVRGLPITSRSSHGRTTRGSGLTVEIFYPGDSGMDDRAVTDFATLVLGALEDHIPGDRASYYIP